MYLLDGILTAFFDALGGVAFFYWCLSLVLVVSTVAALIRPFLPYRYPDS
jgi:predicted lipid-binding transport protein (Tim44 family)